MNIGDTNLRTFKASLLKIIQNQHCPPILDGYSYYISCSQWSTTVEEEYS